MVKPPGQRLFVTQGALFASLLRFRNKTQTTALANLSKVKSLSQSGAIPHCGEDEVSSLLRWLVSLRVA
jgi:hypothetical protein